MIILYAYIVFMFFILRKTSIQRNLFLNFILFVYFISFLSTVLYEYLWGFDYSLDSLPILYLGVVLVLWVLPFKNIGTESVKNFNINNVSSLKVFVLTLSIINSISAAYFIYYAILNISTTSLDVIRGNENTITLFPKNFISNILIYSSSLFSLNIFFFFIALRFDWSRLNKILSLFGSFSFVALTINFAGRDGIIYWTMLFVLNYLLFRSLLSFNILKYLKGLLVLSSSLLILIFLAISVARFYIGYGSYEEVFQSLVSYIGQQSMNFSRSYYVNIPNYNSLFPTIGKLFGYNDVTDIRSLLYNQGYSDQYNVFGFFIKAIVWGYGKFYTVIISFLFYFIVRYFSVKVVRKYDIFSFLIIYLLYQVPLFGVFYYRQGVGGMEVSYIFIILYIIVIRRFSLRS